MLLPCEPPGTVFRSTRRDRRVMPQHTWKLRYASVATDAGRHSAANAGADASAAKNASSSATRPGAEVARSDVPDAAAAIDVADAAAAAADSSSRSAMVQKAGRVCELLAPGGWMWMWGRGGLRAHRALATPTFAPNQVPLWWWRHPGAVLGAHVRAVGRKGAQVLRPGHDPEQPTELLPQLDLRTERGNCIIAGGQSPMRGSDGP